MQKKPPCSTAWASPCIALQSKSHSVGAYACANHNTTRNGSYTYNHTQWWAQWLVAALAVTIGNRADVDPVQVNGTNQAHVSSSKPPEPAALDAPVHHWLLTQSTCATLPSINRI